MDHKTHNISYSSYIRDTIKKIPEGQPIVFNSITNNLVKKYNIDKAHANQIVTLNINRLADNNIVERLYKGVYYRPKNTPLGKLRIDPKNMFIEQLTKEGDQITGYETGPTLFNTVGLSTWTSNDYHLATNKYRRKLPSNVKIELHKPVVEVNNENYRYLQVLDIIDGLDKYHIDAEDPNYVIRNTVKKLGLDVLKILAYADKHYKKLTLLKCVRIFTEDTI